MLSPHDARVVIAVPLGSPLIYWQTVAAILEMEKPAVSEWMVFQGALVDRARNHLVDQMLAHPMQATHLLFLDSDILPPQDGLIRLLQRNLPIVGGVYRRRYPPYEPMAFVKSPPRSPSLEKRGLGGDLRSIPLIKKKGLQPVHTIGTGCLLIQREVFKKVGPPWFTSEWRRSGHLSEDFSFCEKARRVGYKIFADRSVLPRHIEPMGIGTDPHGAVRISSLDR